MCTCSFMAGMNMRRQSASSSLGDSLLQPGGIQGGGPTTTRGMLSVSKGGRTGAASGWEAGQALTPSRCLLVWCCCSPCALLPAAPVQVGTCQPADAVPNSRVVVIGHGVASQYEQ